MTDSGFDRNLPLILASASPRRAELLGAAGIPFEVQVADVDERVLPGEDADAYVTRVARSKAAAVAASAGGRAVLAADTAVIVDDAILGKPADADDARRMLRRLSGRRHRVMTGLCLSRPGPGLRRGERLEQCHVEVTAVEFDALSADEVDWYVASGEPMGKAGGYAIQGLAGRFITRIEGSYSNVVGLPVAVVWRLCRAAGILVS